jgi:hypothetical protein
MFLEKFLVLCVLPVKIYLNVLNFCFLILLLLLNLFNTGNISFYRQVLLKTLNCNLYLYFFFILDFDDELSLCSKICHIFEILPYAVAQFHFISFYYRY